MHGRLREGGCEPRKILGDVRVAYEAMDDDGVELGGHDRHVVAIGTKVGHDCRPWRHVGEGACEA